MISVKATREGLPGHTTASGYVIDRVVPFVALPSERALQRFVELRNPANGYRALAIVLDLGPWNEHDERYVFQNATAAAPSWTESRNSVRPLAESGTDEFGRPTNDAGIDLGEQVWKELGMEDNTSVEWQFLA